MSRTFGILYPRALVVYCFINVIAWLGSGCAASLPFFALIHFLPFVFSVGFPNHTLSIIADSAGTACWPPSSCYHITTSEAAHSRMRDIYVYIISARRDTSSQEDAYTRQDLEPDALCVPRKYSAGPRDGAYDMAGLRIPPLFSERQDGAVL